MEAPKPSLKYFGYCHGDGYPWNGRNDNIDGISQLGNSNVVTFDYYNYNTTENAWILQQYLKKAEDCGLKVLLSLYGCFFGYNPGGLGDGSAKLLHDWGDRYGAVKKAISGYEDILLGFHFDEPFWNGVKPEDFIFVSSVVRREFPGKKVLAVEECASYDPGALGFAGKEAAPADMYGCCTGVSFDLYDGSFERGDYDYWTDLLLRKYLQKGQSMWNYACIYGRNAEHHMKSLAGMYELAVRTPQVEGLLCFTFGGDSGAKQYLTQKESPLYSPQLRDLHLEIGRRSVLK